MQLSPREFVAELDKKIIGQMNAKKTIAIALRNRWRRMQLNEDVRKDITPKNILMIGDTGVGKTAIIRAIADIVDAPLLKVEATRYTQVGYYGETVDTMIEQLAEITHNKLFGKSKNDTPKPATIEVSNSFMPSMDSLANIIYESVMSHKFPSNTLYINELNRNKLIDIFQKEHYAIVSTVGYKGKLGMATDNKFGFYTYDFCKSTIEKNKEIANEFCLLNTPDLSFLAKGLLPDKYLSKDDKENSKKSNLLKDKFIKSKLLYPLYEYANSKNDTDLKDNRKKIVAALLHYNLIDDKAKGESYIDNYIDKTFSQNDELINNMIDIKPKKLKVKNNKKPVDINQSIIDCIHEKGIIFIDEIDKLADTTSSKDNVGKIGVQRDLLSLLDGAEIDTRFGKVKTENIMFITAGAFSLNKVSDLMPELLGRLPIQVKLEPMNLKILKEILTNAENSPLKQNILLLETEGVNVTVTDDGIDAIARFANYINTNYQNMGARTLYAVIDKIFNDISFSAYKESNDIKDIIIDNSFVMNIRRQMINEYENEKFKQLFQQMYEYNYR